MDLINFLRLFVITSLNDIPAAMLTLGGAVFGTIEFCDWVVMTYRKANPISSDTKRQMAGVLAIVLPLTAYFLLGYLEHTQYSLNGVFLAAAFGFVSAKGMHDLVGRYTAKITGAEAAQKRMESADHRENKPHEE